MTVTRSFILRKRRSNHSFYAQYFFWKIVKKYGMVGQATDDNKCCTENMRFFTPDICSKNTDTLIIFIYHFLFHDYNGSSSLLSKNLKIKIYITIILPVVLHGCGTWSLTLREECRLRVFENRVWRRIFGPKRDEVTEGGGNSIMRNSMICTAHPILCG